MNLTATYLLDQFCVRHPGARILLARWVQGISASTLTNFNQLKQIYRHADYSAPYTIFNVGGNKSGKKIDTTLANKLAEYFHVTPQLFMTTVTTDLS